jgi:thiol:disulfide interchange protein
MKNQFFKIQMLALGILFLSILTCSKADAQGKAQEIKFTTATYQQVLAMAKASHKKVFVDAFADWCAPCKELRKTTFKNAKTAAYFNKHYVNFSINVEKGEGVDLAKTWQIEGLPTLLIVDENGKVLANHTGYVDGNGLIEFSKEASVN